jgi:hypothetical protein
LSTRDDTSDAELTIAGWRDRVDFLDQVLWQKNMSALVLHVCTPCAQQLYHHRVLLLKSDRGVPTVLSNITSPAQNQSDLHNSGINSFGIEQIVARGEACVIPTTPN